MGTRSLTYVHDGSKKDATNGVLCMYRQMDGYPSGHGKELYDFLKDFKMTNGLGMDRDPNVRIANGVGCLAAQLVAHFKTDPGGFYLYNPLVGDVGQEYEYHISANTFEPDSGIHMRVVVPHFSNRYTGNTRRDRRRDKVLFEGTIAEMALWLELKGD